MSFLLFAQLERAQSANCYGDSASTFLPVSLTSQNINIRYGQSAVLHPAISCYFPFFLSFSFAFLLSAILSFLVFFLGCFANLYPLKYIFNYFVYSQLIHLQCQKLRNCWLECTCSWIHFYFVTTSITFLIVTWFTRSNCVFKC